MILGEIKTLQTQTNRDLGRDRESLNQETGGKNMESAHKLTVGLPGVEGGEPCVLFLPQLRELETLQYLLSLAHSMGVIASFRIFSDRHFTKLVGFG